MAKATRAIRNTLRFVRRRRIDTSRCTGSRRLVLLGECTSNRLRGWRRGAQAPRRSAARLGPRGPVGVSDVEGVGEVGDLGRRRRRGGGGRIRVRGDAAARRVARVRERARAVRPPRADAQGSAQAFTSQRALWPAAAPGEVDEAALVAAYAADRVAVARLVQILPPRRGRLAEQGPVTGVLGGRRGAGARGAAAGRAGAVPWGAAATAGPSRAQSAPPCAS